jgi:hypothetical protein
MKDYKAFWDASPQDIARGYAETASGFKCLLCEKVFEKGIVYEIGGIFYDASRAAAEHVKAVHGSVFMELLLIEKKYTGLTPRQAEVLQLMYQGLNDREVVEKTTGGSTSTIRNLRFQLKEREKQAKAFLSLMEAFRLEKGSMERGRDSELIPIHEGVTILDERFAITESDREAVLKAYFSSGAVNNKLPVKEKKKIIVILELIKRFEAGRNYTEKEVNQLIGTVFSDFATLRRYMIEYGLMERTTDCRQYWVKEP